MTLECQTKYTFHLNCWQRFSRRGEQRHTPLNVAVVIQTSGNKNPDVSLMSTCWKGLIRYPVWIHYCLIAVWSFRLTPTELVFWKNTPSVVFKDRCICMNTSCRRAVPPWPSFPSFLTSSRSPPLLSAFLEYQLLSLHSSPVWQLFCTSPLFFVFLPFSVPTQTFTHRFRGMSGMRPFLQHHVVVAHWAATAGPEGARVFLQGPWMDGWIDTALNDSWRSGAVLTQPSPAQYLLQE